MTGIGSMSFCIIPRTQWWKHEVTHVGLRRSPVLSMNDEGDGELLHYSIQNEWVPFDIAEGDLLLESRRQFLWFRWSRFSRLTQGGCSAKERWRVRGNLLIGFHGRRVRGMIWILASKLAPRWL